MPESTLYVPVRSGIARVEAIPIEWHPVLSVCASETFLKLVGDEVGWIGGFDPDGELLCILPYTIVEKSRLRMARFRVETMVVEPLLSIEDERSFLEQVLEFLRERGADVVIPAGNTAVFRTFPKGANAAPYGSFIADLMQPEDTLWKNLHSKHRNVIRNAEKRGVEIKWGLEYADAAHEMITKTLKRSSLKFMGQESFRKFVDSLGENITIGVSEHEGKVQGCAVFPLSRFSSYYTYGGSTERPFTGAINLLHWKSMLRFRGEGVERYDFGGTRIEPDNGSKQKGLTRFKQRFGGKLNQGYIWKFPLRPLKAQIYSLAVRLLRGGDIVDLERHKLESTQQHGAGDVV